MSDNTDDMEAEREREEDHRSSFGPDELVDCPCAPCVDDQRAPDDYVLCVGCGALLPPERVSRIDKLCVVCQGERERWP